MTTHTTTTGWAADRKAVAGGLALAWFAVAYFVGSGEWLVNDQQSLLPPIGITGAIPVLAFLAAYGMSSRFRAFVLSWDVTTLTALQHWRVIGFVFLALYAYGVLPGLFAWPAGLGDVAVGVTAAFVVTRLRRDAAFVATKRFLWFNYMGLLDFASAIVTSGLAAGAFPALIPAGITSAPMDVWPLSLFPSFIVPFFIILHLAVLLKLRALRRAAPAGTPAVAEVA